MDRASVYRIPATPDVLRAATTETVLPSVLAEPMQALVAGITRRTAEGPLSIYVCADDESLQLRDDVAFLMARTLSAHIPSALLVDCDFLHTGLHGLVPQKDALGFLDFLLYGSSIGVITQESHGVRFVGAGSFPVTRRMPFVDTAFVEASRRLAAHARCAIFVGPLTDEQGNPHPLTAEVDAVAVVVAGERAPVLAVVDQVAERAADVWTIQLGAVPAPAPPVRSSRPEAPARAPAPVLPTGVPPRPPREQEPRYSSLVPRIAIIAFGVVVIAFAVWWFWQGRNADQLTDEGPTGTRPGATGAAVVPEPADTVAARILPDTTGVAASADSSAAAAPDTVARVATAPVNPADTGGRTGGTLLINPADIHVMADLDARWRDWYMIHISSFQESIRAREEVDFLQSREFPVFIVFLDLGAKGKWYRVYCGPFRTRDEAREVKKNLDAVPQVRFTRIAKIPE
jgi:cell division septation protein DedD